MGLPSLVSIEVPWILHSPPCEKWLLYDIKKKNLFGQKTTFSWGFHKFDMLWKTYFSFAWGASWNSWHVCCRRNFAEFQTQGLLGSEILSFKLPKGIIPLHYWFFFLKICSRPFASIFFDHIFFDYIFLSYIGHKIVLLFVQTSVCL